MYEDYLFNETAHNILGEEGCFFCRIRLMDSYVYGGWIYGLINGRHCHRKCLKKAVADKDSRLERLKKRENHELCLHTEKEDDPAL